MNIFRKKFFLFCRRYIPSLVHNSQYLEYLRDIGMEIGRGTVFFDASRTFVATQRPWMIRIGEFVKITAGVTILDHDYSRSVLRRRYNKILCEAKETVIGNNVFIGINSVILMGAQIGNNCIIGAGSIVNGIFPDDVVIAGNPARVICSLEDFYNRRLENQNKEAILFAKKFYRVKKRFPCVHEMTAFFHLFEERSIEALKRDKVFIKWNGDEESQILDSFLSSSPLYESYNEFLEVVKKEMNS